MIAFLYSLPSRRIWWLGLAALCVTLEGIALYYQYALGYLPCVLCIHVRMLLFALLLLALVGVFSGHSRRIGVILMLPTTMLWIWMLERSYQLLGTERGWIMGECQMASGLPDWLALEQWMPWLFRIHEPCGYTPFVLFRVSMAEILIVLSAFMVLLCLASLVASLRQRSPA